MPKSSRPMPIGTNAEDTLLRNTIGKTQLKKSQDIPVTEDMAKALGIPSNRPAKPRVATRDPFPNIDRSASRPKWSK